MKLKSTTPASLSKVTIWATISLLLIASIVAGVFYFNKPASADQYDAKINALQADMSRYQAEADRLNSQAVTLGNAVAQLTNEKNALQAQVDLSQAQHDKLVIQIAETEQQIASNQDALGLTIADLYVDDNISPIEMLASSQNIGDFLNKQEFRNAVKDELSSTIKEVKALKLQLATQKEDVTKVLGEQKFARDELAAKEAEQANLLARTQSDEAAYQGLIKSSQKQIDDARAVQAELRARLNNNGGYSIVNSGSLTAYPWQNGNCPMLSWMSTGGADGNGGDGQGYGCRQCASYVAWKVAKETGKYYRWGNGGDFYGNAVRAGYRDLGRTPQPGSLAVMLGTPGHVAWVEDVSADGTKVRVSQYNYNYGAGWGLYSDMWLSTGVFDRYVKIT